MLESILLLLKPFVDSIRIVESDGSMLSDVVEQCLIHQKNIQLFNFKLLKSVKKEVNAYAIWQIVLNWSHFLQIETIILARTKSMMTEDHIIAYAIDPRFRGSNLDSEQLGIVHSFFQKNQQLNDCYRLFKGKLGNSLEYYSSILIRYQFSCFQRQLSLVTNEYIWSS